MAFLRTVLVAALASTALALPFGFRLSDRQVRRHDIARRQMSGLTDLDIAEFALTLEWLEGTFYQQALTNIPASAMLAIGLTEKQVTDVFQIASTELEHVIFLQETLAGAGSKPVMPCTYNFGTAVTDAATFVQTALILESVGVSAYLGAAPLVSSKAILSAAASIVTVEARHETFFRTALGQSAVPSAFDGALGPRAVFSLAAPFITSCPSGSNLAITAFPPLTMAGSTATPVAGQKVMLSSPAMSGAKFCGFTSGDPRPGGTVFQPFDAATGCQIPDPARGVQYVTLTSSAAPDGILTDDITLAGPMVMTVT